MYNVCIMYNVYISIWPIVLDPLHFDADPDPRIRSGITDLDKIPVFLHTLKKNYILIILVNLNLSWSQFFLLPGSGSTFPEVEEKVKVDKLIGIFNV